MRTGYFGFLDILARTTFSCDSILLNDLRVVFDKVSFSRRLPRARRDRKLFLIREIADGFRAVFDGSMQFVMHLPERSVLKH